MTLCKFNPDSPRKKMKVTSERYLAFLWKASKQRQCTHMIVYGHCLFLGKCCSSYIVNQKKWRPTFGCLFLPRITVCHATLYLYDMHIMIIYGYWSKPWHLVNPKIAGKWMFIPLELIIIGFDPPPYVFRKSQHETHTETPLGRGPPFAAASVFAKPRGSGSALRF